MSDSEEQMIEQQSDRNESDMDVSMDGAHPLLAQIRRQLYDDINQMRKKNDLQQFYIDMINSEIANDYATYLKTSEHSQEHLSYIWDQYQQLGKPKVLYVMSRFEEGVDINEQQLIENFKQIGYLMMECSEEQKEIMNDTNNHIGIGIASNNEFIILVLIVSSKVISVTNVTQEDNTKLYIKGKMLDEDQWGLMAVSVMDVDAKQEVVIVGPEKIQFDRKTKEYQVGIDLKDPFSVYRRMTIDLYLRSNPDSIAYGRIKEDKIKKGTLRKEMKILCKQFPDSNMINTDGLTFDFQTQEDQSNLLEQDQEEESEESIDNKDDDLFIDDKLAQQFVYQDNSQNKNKEESKTKVNLGGVSNKDIKEELDLAIMEAQKTAELLNQENRVCQEKIILMKNRNELQFDKQQGDVAMNEHKYLNTLAHVHQIREDLRTTQERYNQMAFELQTKLLEKQNKCNEIRGAFMELKREVAKKAVFSRTDKPMNKEQIAEWEKKEKEKNITLSDLRLENLRLRNNLTKNQKILKKKEELAEGLHLIDFEQLKIENQNLNEKIEERNEDLHKLKNKNIVTVQILTHTKEKLVYMQDKIEQLTKSHNQLVNEKKELSNTLSTLKTDKKNNRDKKFKEQQKTAIINNRELKNDFEQRFKVIDQLKEQKKQLEDELNVMDDAIAQHQEFKKQTSQQMNGVQNYQIQQNQQAHQQIQLGQ